MKKKLSFKQIFTFLLIAMPMMVMAQTKSLSGYVGDILDLQLGYSDSQIYTADWKEWDGPTNCVTLNYTPVKDRATVRIDSYFTGTVRIRCQYQLKTNATKTEYFNITCNPVTLNVSPTSMSLQDVGDSEAITYTTSPSGKWPTVSYSSSNNSVATVNLVGVVQAKGKGTATITVSNSMGPDAKINVSVAGAGPTPPGPDPDPTPDPTIKDGDYFQDYTAEGTLMLFMAGTSSMGEIYAIVVPNNFGGACISSANGRVTIPSSAKGLPVRAISSAAFKSLSGLTELVIPNTVTSVNPNAIYLCENITSVTCEATTPPSLFLSSGRICDIDYKCVLYVPKGCVSKYESAAGWKSFGAIKEIGNSIEQIKLTANPSGGAIEKGKTVTLSTNVSGADIYYTTNNTAPSKTNGSKYSTPITINQDLTLRAIAYKVGYKDSEELKETYTIKSASVDPTGITVSPYSKTIKVDETFTPTYTLTPSNATTTVTWSSDNSSIASVNSTTGKVTGIKAGTTYINATTSNGKTDWCKVTVEDSGISINATNFPDANFRSYLLAQDYGKDGVLTKNEIDGIKEIDLGLGYISSLKGIGYFTALTYLDCSFNSLTALDVSKNTALTSLYCYSNKLTALDVSKNTALTSLSCGSDQLTALDVSKNTALTTLWCYKNHIKGAAMDRLINSLPQNGINRILRIIYDKEEGNVITKKQVDAAKAKGWTPYYFDADVRQWLEYEGSNDNPSGIVLPEMEISNANAPIYNLSGQKVADVKKGIYIVNGKKVVIK